jgi:hypothetical protein
VLKATVSIPTTEKRALLFQSIERAVHFRDNCFGLIRQRDQFDIDLMVFVSLTASGRILASVRKLLDYGSNSPLALTQKSREQIPGGYISYIEPRRCCLRN